MKHNNTTQHQHFHMEITLEKVLTVGQIRKKMSSYGLETEDDYGQKKEECVCARVYRVRSEGGQNPPRVCKCVSGRLDIKEY